MKNTQEKREKAKRLKAKNSIREIGRVPEKVKKWLTGELELFKKIAEQMRDEYDMVVAKHIDKNWNETQKRIHVDDLTVSNMSHKIPKSRGEEYRLDPDNIEIVSFAWHHYEHTGQILKIDYSN